MLKSKSTKRKRMACGMGVLTILAYVSYLMVQWWTITTIPFTLATTKEGWKRIRFPVKIKGRELTLFLDTGRGQTEIKESIWKDLAYGEVIQLLNDKSFKTEISVLGFHRESYVHDLSRRIEAMGEVGLVGNDLFQPATEVGPTGPSSGCRLTLDFKRSLMTIDSRPWRGIYHPTEGSLSLPLTIDDSDKSANLTYTAPLSVNGLPSFRFGIDTGSPIDVVLPEAIMQRISGHKDVLQFTKNPLNVTVSCGKTKWALKAYPQNAWKEMGILGLPVLMKYHVVWDYRDKMLYLEPPQ
jgi:hypothetical protein